MNGLSTRIKLHAAVQPDHQCDDAYTHPRTRDLVMGYGAHEDFALPRHPFMPNFYQLGTPGEAARDAGARIERLWLKWARIAAALILALLALSLYHHLRIGPWQRHQPIDDKYLAHARRLIPGGHRVDFDPHERCPVIMHKDAAGNAIVTTHC